MKLTDMAIKRAKSKEKAYTLADGGGLSLLVDISGSKGWRFRYQFAGKTKMLSLGVYKKLIAGGINPSDVRKAQKQELTNRHENTFEGIVREWYEKRFDRWSPSYAEEMIETFEKDVFPLIGSRPIVEIKPMELMAVLSRLNDRGATEKLRKVRQRYGEVWRYAIVTGRAEYNPAPDLASAFAPHKKTHYAFLKVDEIPAFCKALNTYTGSFLVKMAMRLQMITGVRPGELRKAEWSEINFDNRAWAICFPWAH